MALEKLVAEINEDLRTQRDEAVAHRENPRIISFLNSMIRLTNSEEQNEIEDEAKTAAEPEPKGPTDAEVLAAFRAGKIKVV